MIQLRFIFQTSPKLSQEQREYYGELAKGLTNGLSKIDEYRKSSKKVSPLTTGTVKRQPYNTAALRAIALMEPYFSFYRTKYADNWLFFDKAPTHDEDKYVAIKERCENLNLRPYITIRSTGGDYAHCVTLCDYGVLQIHNFSKGDYHWFVDYADIKQITILKKPVWDAMNVNFGAAESVFKTCLGISMTASTKADEQKEIADMLYDFIRTVNGGCKKVERTKFLGI